MVSGLVASHFSCVGIGISLAALGLVADGVMVLVGGCWLGGYRGLLLLGFTAVGFCCCWAWWLMGFAAVMFGGILFGGILFGSCRYHWVVIIGFAASSCQHWVGGIKLVATGLAGLHVGDAGFEELTLEAAGLVVLGMAAINLVASRFGGCWVWRLLVWKLPDW